ncbi:MAG TPA: ATP-binding cassette domain-containing protein [Spirochaetes bacterium]|nr:ATP-binding cassette domain-containing protein [Spirochaetota bacterium]
MAIKVIRVTKVYESSGNSTFKLHAVKNVSMDINEGSYTLLLGPTGSGKTTLLSLIAGIVEPTKGEIVFNNIYITSSNDSKISQFRERYIGYVPQTNLFIKELNVIENILSPNSFLKRQMRHLKTYAMEMLEKLNMDRKAGMKPFELSGGEMKKAMIVRALVKKPLFILADEPFSELDSGSTKSVMALLKEQRENGSAIIVASHDQLSFEKEIDLYTLAEGQVVTYEKRGVK